MRIYKNITYDSNRDIIHTMQSLTSPNISTEDYRNAFYHLGKSLGCLLNNKTSGIYGNTMLSCASEDADWLAVGVLETLTQKNVSLAVFWNERITLSSKSKLEYSPIIGSYIEPIERCQTLILVKSIISTSCVIKSQLMRLINDVKPQNIYIVAPVMYKDAENSLKNEFPKDINKKFNFITFAIDNERDVNNCIIPGIGGMVYSKLGLGDSHGKNKYIPEIVRKRSFTTKK